MTIFDWLKQRNIIIKDKDLMLEAFTHTSFYNEHRFGYHDNERIEYLGDAVLQIWSADNLYRLKPELSEGEMTTLRSQIVCEKSLANFARKLELNQFIRLGKGEEKSGGRNKDSIISDMFEAFIGALFLSKGIKVVYQIMSEVVDFNDLDSFKEDIVDYKTQLQEFVQTDSRENVSYVLVNQSGPSNSPEFMMNVVLEGIVLGCGCGPSKKKAEQQAAKDALNKLVK